MPVVRALTVTTIPPILPARSGQRVIPSLLSLKRAPTAIQSILRFIFLRPVETDRIEQRGRVAKLLRNFRPRRRGMFPLFLGSGTQLCERNGQDSASHHQIIAGCSNGPYLQERGWLR